MLKDAAAEFNFLTLKLLLHKHEKEVLRLKYTCLE